VFIINLSYIIINIMILFQIIISWPLWFIWSAYYRLLFSRLYISFPNGL